MPARTMTLVDSAKRCASAQKEFRDGRSAPFWIHETHFMYTRAALNGAEGLYWINTGMQGVAIAANNKAYAHAGIGAPLVTRADEIAFVEVGSLSFPGAYTLERQRGAYGYFLQEATSDKFRVDGMVGLLALGAQRWTIDFDQRTFYFGPSKAGAGAPAPTKKGQ